MNNAIASFHWRACQNCKHATDMRSGSTCSVRTHEWESQLEYEMDEMVCWAFEERPPNKVIAARLPLPAGARPGQVGDQGEDPAPSGSA